MRSELVGASIEHRHRSGRVEAAWVGPLVVEWGDTGEIERRRQRLEWLDNRAGTPRLLEVDPDGSWLVSARARGTPASSGEHGFDLETTLDAAARLLLGLHEVPVDGCPGRLGPGDLLTEAGQRVETEIRTSAALDPPFRRFTPAQLLELVSEDPPDATDLVVAHGRFGLDAVLVDHGQPGGLVDVDRLAVADRHLDLALAARDLVARVGPEALPVFFDAYGIDPDPFRLDWYSQLVQLL